MNLFARHSWLLLPVATCLFLAADWLVQQTTVDVPWGWILAITFVLLLLAGLKKQWRPPSDAHDRVEPTWWSRIWHLRTSRVLPVAERKNLFRFEFVVLALVAAGILYQVLLPPVVGLANNGDFERLMGQAGLSYAAPDSRGDRFEFVELHFRTDRPSEPMAGYFSSEVIFVDTALILAKVTSAHEFFDLRVLGALHATVFLTGLALVLFATRTLPSPSRWVSSVLVLLVFTDVGYVSYFNSLYREAAALIFLVLIVGCALLHIRVREPRFGLLLAYFFAAALFVTAKPQYAPQALLLAGFGVLLSRRWSWGSYRRWTSVGAAAVLCSVGIWSYADQPNSLERAVLYNHVFSDLLVHSSTPRADLAGLGLNPSLVKWAGTDAFEERAPIENPAFEKSFFSHATPTTLAGFYATHPERAIGLLNRAADQGLSLRPGYLGNFTKTSGLAQGAQASAFDVWSNLREFLLIGSLAGLSFLFGVAVSAGALVRNRCKTLQDTLLAEFFLFLVVMATVQFAVVCLGGGTLDIVKHLFVFNLLVDMATIMAVSYAAKWWSDVVS